MSKEEVVKEIISKLKNVYDPEIPINVWDLGLIYDIKVDDEGRVNLKMTLTAPGCPIANLIVQQVAAAVQGVKGVKEINVDVVFDPPWDPSRMTKEGREKFKQIYGYDIVEAYKKSKGS